MNLLQRMRKVGTSKKGFTLVELIVVLVILAILLAILVPSLVGWINRARTRGDLVEARQVYLAAQTLAEENDMVSLTLAGAPPTGSNLGESFGTATIRLAVNAAATDTVVIGSATAGSKPTQNATGLNGALTALTASSGSITSFTWQGQRSTVTWESTTNTLVQKPY